jgi:hypothetical protein
VNSSDESTRVFIVRAWREPREIEGAAHEWRGVIEYVPDGARQYWKDLVEITAFIARHLGLEEGEVTAPQEQQTRVNSDSVLD